jgi:hypothetical protein
MSRLTLRRRVVSLGALSLMLSGCGGFQAPVSPSGMPPQFAALLDGKIPKHPDLGPSWIARAAQKEILYVSDDGANAVYTYAYPSGRKIGKLTHLPDASGVCTDTAGDVWIVETAVSHLVEYAHGGTKQIATRDDPGFHDLLGCAVDPSTGNLAVADLGGPTGGGNVAIYADAKGTPKKYKASSLQAAYFVGYDDSGNLFVDGVNSSGTFELLELPSGGSSLQTITLNESVGFPGGVEWDGQYIAIGDQKYQDGHTSAIYQVAVSGSAGTVEGTTKLTGSCDVLQFAVSGGTVGAPDACLNDVGLYNYPAGGSPTVTITGLQYPVAAAVSIASSPR